MAKEIARIAYTVEDVPASEGQDDTSRWTRIGVSFENKDGLGNHPVPALPVTP